MIKGKQKKNVIEPWDSVDFSPEPACFLVFPCLPLCGFFDVFSHTPCGFFLTFPQAQIFRLWRGWGKGCGKMLCIFQWNFLLAQNVNTLSAYGISRFARCEMCLRHVKVEKLRFSKLCRSFGTSEVQASLAWSVLLRKTVMCCFATLTWKSS